MTKRYWTLLSSHGKVLAFVAKHPKSTTQVMAHAIGLSIRGVQEILDDLEEAKYISREREGRRNHYIVHPETPMRHRLQRKVCVGDVLLAIGAIPEGDQ